ncbi:MAG: orotidine-5'-phosphate [Geobacteraceae bacterium]|nr:MAG: orotidine-5'-phosphate [Geobacteraceae bacterium]
MTRDEARSRIIFALDVETIAEARHWVSVLTGRVGMFKIGKQLFTAHGPEIVRMVENYGGEVFLDLKYHDIPNTVAMASREAARLGVKLFNLHALGGYEMMAGTVEMLDREFTGMKRPKVLAVTILTSSTEATLREVGIDLPVQEMVVRLAKLAKKAGIDGVVASPLEVPLIREACGNDFLIVTPGVRPASSSTDDQKRVMTPGEAVAAGSDYLVIGRPIAAAPDPLRACETIIDEIMGVQQESVAKRYS